MLSEWQQQHSSSSTGSGEPACRGARTAQAEAPGLVILCRLPKLIHQTVINKSRLSCEEKQVIDSWKRLNPNHTHHLWDDAEMRQFMQQVSPGAWCAIRGCLGCCHLIAVQKQL